jgi:hypothetical protein
VSGTLDVPVPAHRRRARACFSSLVVLTTLTSLLSLCEYQPARTPRSATYWTGAHLYSLECVEGVSLLKNPSTPLPSTLQGFKKPRHCSVLALIFKCLDEVLDNRVVL